MRPFLSVYGHVSIDQIVFVDEFPRKNTSADITRKDTRLGGTGANIAVMAASLGVPTAICAFVGEDFPPKYEDTMRSKGLIMDEFVKVPEYETSQAIVVNDGGMDQKVLFYQGPQGHATKLGRYLTSNAGKSVYTHFCTGEPDYYISVMGTVRASGGRIALDPAQEVYKAWDGERFRRALELTDMLFCNQHEMGYILGYLGAGDLSGIDKELVVCTKGSQGSIAYIDGRALEIPAVTPRRVRDVTGAGDGYRAGFYAGRYHGLSVTDSLVAASAVASFVVEDVGALSNIPSWDAVMERAEGLLGRI